MQNWIKSKDARNKIGASPGTLPYLNNTAGASAACRIILLALIIPLVLAFILPSCSKTEKGSADPISQTEFLLDTVCVVSVYDKKDEQYITGALKLCSDYEKLLSRTIESSDVSKINNAGGKPVKVSDKTAELISKAKYYAEDSGGVFDVTIGAVSGLWDFIGSESTGAVDTSSDTGLDTDITMKASKVPDAQEIADNLPSVDYNNIQIQGSEISLKDPRTKLDLGGIAKGYIADEMAKYLLQNGVKSALIDLGGNIVVVGKKAEGTPWRVGVRNPFSQGENGTENQSILGTIAVKAEKGESKSIGSSGTYERYFVLDGVRYHHILDPKTGMSAQTDLAGVTALTDLSVDGEGITTTCILLGSVGAKKYLEQRGIPAVLVMSDGTIITTCDIEFEKVAK